jgi:phosphomannomutase
VDSEIISEIDRNLKPWDGIDKNIEKYAQTLQDGQPLLRTDLSEVIQAYYTESKAKCSFFSEENKTISDRVVYTPMHGVGTPYVEEIMKAFNLPAVIPVEQQKDPHPDFPTVPFPNPEEGRGALVRRHLYFFHCTPNNTIFSTNKIHRIPLCGNLAISY